MSWVLAKSLTKLREQLNAAHPSRATTSDRDIGDEHKPNEGVVLGLDITDDPENGVDGHVLSRALAQDSRVNYVIFHDEIWRCYVPAWTKHTPYLPHIHVSVLASLGDDDSEWSLEATNALLFPEPDFRAIAERLADPVQDPRNSAEPDELSRG